MLQCAAGEEELPQPTAGFWISSVRTLGDTVQYCYPPSACVGRAVGEAGCAVCRRLRRCRGAGAVRVLTRVRGGASQSGYTGWSCAACDTGYGMVNRFCLPCPGEKEIVGKLLGMLGVNFLIGALVFRHQNVKLAADAAAVRLQRHAFTRSLASGHRCRLFPRWALWWRSSSWLRARS
jgi:hypothetical protein